MQIAYDIYGIDGIALLPSSFVYFKFVHCTHLCFGKFDRRRTSTMDSVHIKHQTHTQQNDQQIEFSERTRRRYATTCKVITAEICNACSANRNQVSHFSDMHRK